MQMAAGHSSVALITDCTVSEFTISLCYTPGEYGNYIYVGGWSITQLV